MLYVVPQSVVYVGSYILLSLVFFGQSFCYKGENVGFALGMINNTYPYIKGSICTQQIEEVNTAIPSSISNFLYRYLYLYMFNYLLLVLV